MNNFCLDSIDNLSLMLEEAENTLEAVDLELSVIVPDPAQPRKERDGEKDKEFSDNVAKVGVYQPILVRWVEDLSSYMIIFGHRRYDASVLAGKKTIPCLIKKDVTESDIKSMQVIENIQREDMVFFDEINAISDLIVDFGVSETAKVLGKKSQHISKIKKVSNSKKFIVDFISQGFSSDLSFLYELCLLEEIDSEKTKKIVDSWVKSPSLRVNLRGQVQRVKKELLDAENRNKKEPDELDVKLKAKKEGVDLPYLSEVEDILSENKDDALSLIKGGVSGFKIDVGESTSLSFLSKDKEVTIRLNKKMWSSFINEIKKC